MDKPLLPPDKKRCAAMTRRFFLRACCVVAAAFLASRHAGQAWARAMSVKEHMYERILCIYCEEQMFAKRTAQDNVQIQRLYSQFFSKPMDEKAMSLLHASRKDRSRAIRQMKQQNTYPGVRGGKFRYLKYPFESE